MSFRIHTRVLGWHRVPVPHRSPDSFVSVFRCRSYRIVYYSSVGTLTRSGLTNHAASHWSSLDSFPTPTLPTPSSHHLVTPLLPTSTSPTSMLPTPGLTNGSRLTALPLVSTAHRELCLSFPVRPGYSFLIHITACRFNSLLKFCLFCCAHSLLKSDCSVLLVLVLICDILFCHRFLVSGCPLLRHFPRPPLSILVGFCSRVTREWAAVLRKSP